MNIITPDCEYKTNIEQYKQKMAHLPAGSRVLVKRSDPAGISEALIGNWELNLISIPVEPYSTHKSVMEFITADCMPHAIVNCTDNKVIFEFIDGGDLSPVTDHAIFYTSGTTGNPKGVVQTRAGMESNARTVAKLHGFDQTSVHLTALPLYHCNAAAMSLFGNYFNGGTAVFLKRFTTENYFKFINEYGATTANLVPTFVADLVKAKQPWPISLKYVLTAATALSQEICKNFFELYGPRLRQGYGLSEAVNFSFTMPLLDSENFKKHMVENYPAVGLPIDGTEFRLVDGEVQVRGPNTMRCYWNNPTATNAALTDDGWLRTGDRGEQRDGFMVLTGRFKEIIIKGGDNYSPVMIEDEFRRSNIVGDLAVVSAADARLGEDIGLVVEQYQPIVLNTQKLQPAAVRFAKVSRTQTRKPQRNIMRRGLVSMALEDQYRGDLAEASKLAKHILKLALPKNAQQFYIWHAAEKLAKFEGTGSARPVVKHYFKIIDQHIEEFWAGQLSGHELIKKANAWENLMCMEPMGNYAKLTNQFVRENDLLGLDFLEVGAGVGNFTRLVIQDATGKYTRSDLKSKFLHGAFGTAEAEVDISVGSVLTADVVVGVNVFHCVPDYANAVQNMWKSVRPSGTLIITEGNPDPSGHGVWALDLLFGLIDGWWDAGGFRTRQEWLDVLNTLDAQEFGYSVYREGSNDCGGLYWAKKQ